VVVSCAGVPGLVQGEWIKPGAGVVSVGVSFCEERGTLLPDVDETLDSLRHASFVVSAPGGVGPLSLALLMRNVVSSARRRLPALHALAGADSSTPPADASALGAFLHRHPQWRLAHEPELPLVGGGGELLPPARGLVRELELASHQEAASLLGKAGGVGDGLNHHVAHATVEHHCKSGVRLTLHAYTTSTGDVTAYDLELAERIDSLAGGAAAGHGA